MKFNKSQIKKFTYVTLFCIFCVVISRLILFSIYFAKTGNTSITSYILDFNKWDSGWYNSIITHGYHNEPCGNIDGDAANWAFFPLMPFFLRILSSAFNVSPDFIGPVSNTIIFTLALIIAWYYIEETRNKETSCIFVFLMTLGMYSFYFSSTYTEALYLFFIVSFFYAMRKEKYILMGIIRFSCISYS